MHAFLAVRRRGDKPLLIEFEHYRALWKAYCWLVWQFDPLPLLYTAMFAPWIWAIKAIVGQCFSTKLNVVNIAMLGMLSRFLTIFHRRNDDVHATYIEPICSVMLPLKNSVKEYIIFNFHLVYKLWQSKRYNTLPSNMLRLHNIMIDGYNSCRHNIMFEDTPYIYWSCSCRNAFYHNTYIKIKFKRNATT